MSREFGRSSSVETLCDAARSDDPTEREAALEALARRSAGSRTIGDEALEAAGDAIADCVLDPDRDVQLTAIELVGQLELEGALASLSTVMERSVDEEVRVAAVQAVGRIGGDEAVPPLLTALDDGPTPPARAALEGIESIGREAVAERLLDRLETAIEAEDEPTVDGDEQPILDADEQFTVDADEQPHVDADEQPHVDADEQPTVAALETALRRVDSAEAIRTVRERQRSDPAIEAAIGRLEHRRRIVDEHGLVSAAAFESPDPLLRADAADEVGRVLEPADPDRDRATVELGHEFVATDTDLTPDELVERLLDCLEDDDLAVRSEAALSALGPGDSRALAPLAETIARASDEDPDVAESAILALQLMWPGRRIERLVRQLKRSDDARGEVAGVLTWTLRKQGSTSVPLPSTRLAAWLAGRRARRALADAAPGEREPEDVATLALTGDTDDVPLLLSTLDDPDELVRSQAAFALGHLGISRRTLTMESAAVRAGFTIDDFGGVRDDRVPPALLDALRTEDEPLVLAQLADALGTYAETDAVEELLVLLDRPEPLCRETAAAALGRVGDPRTIDPLADRLETDDSELVRSAAARALGAIGDGRTVEALDDALQRENSERVRISAAGALGRVDSPAAERALTEAAQIDDAADVRRAARHSSGGTPFRGTRYEASARSIRRSSLSALGVLFTLAWAIYLPLRRVAGLLWTVTKPVLGFLLNALLGWLLLFALLVFLVLVITAIGAVL